ncbi:hypothetical protein QWY99_11900 [Flavobacterium branchiarum]|uniref:hypothetical protein n=1 Tax=Flavobacterium branchiarum TaxID=1114870 RepID=UPI0025B6195C|nr:hypothetical protein [Flavobacterium branchiarum]MDN3673757.1 hypothetical protein [Flavobacterium branchiarum]
MLNSNNSSRNASRRVTCTVMIHSKAKHNILGTDVNYDFNPNWKLNAKVNGAMSVYEIQISLKPLLLRNKLCWKNITSISTGIIITALIIIPETDEEICYCSQNISTNIKKHNLYANVILSDFAPKYYSFETQQKSANNRIDIGNRFPKFRDFSLNLGINIKRKVLIVTISFFEIQTKMQTKKCTPTVLSSNFHGLVNSSRQSAVFST